MFENIANFFRKLVKSEKKEAPSKDTAKERLHLVLMQDRANVSADFMELMRQEIIEVIKKYIDIDESAIDVRLTNEIGEDGTKGAPALYANIPIKNIKNGLVSEELKNNVNEKKEDIKNKEEKQEEEKTSENETEKQANNEASEQEIEETQEVQEKIDNKETVEEIKKEETQVENEEEKEEIQDEEKEQEDIEKEKETVENEN